MKGTVQRITLLYRVSQFVCSLFNNTFNSSEYTALDDRMITGLKYTWKEVITVYFISSWHLHGGIENHEKSQSG